MSIATEIQRIKTAIANAYTAVSGKGGTVPQSAVVGNLATAIGSIPTETPLPTLTNPAAADDIILHKEAIDGQGAKLTGTLDPLEDAELDPDSPPEIVSGELEIELVHGQDFVKELTYSVPDAVPENIVSGKTILGVTGSYTGGGETEVTVTSDCVNAAEVAAALAPLIPGYNNDYNSSAIFKSVDSFATASINQVLFVSLNARSTSYSGMWARKSSSTTVYEATSFASVYTNTVIHSGAKFKMVTLAQSRP